MAVIKQDRRITTARGFAAMAISLALAACGGQTTLTGGPSVSVVGADHLPVPQRKDITAATREYLIGPYDTLSISVFGISELQATKIQVDAGGMMSFPLVGAIQAAGHTPAELAAEIEKGLQGKYVREPQVTVNLDETVSQVVTVEGEVKQPGLYPVVGRMTLLRAVARAEGTTEFAKLNYVVVFRTVDNLQYAALYDLKQIRTGAMADPEIYANDVVVVGESRARRVFKDLLQASPLLTSPLIAVLNNTKL